MSSASVSCHPVNTGDRWLFLNMTRCDRPTILERLQVGGLDPDLVRAWKRRPRRPCQCASCREREADPPTATAAAGASGETAAPASPVRAEARDG